MSRWTADSRWYREKGRPAFLAANTTCWICGHPGSDEVDHVISPKLRPDLAMDMRNWRPAHGHRRCPQCGLACNQARGDRIAKPIAPVTSRRW